MLLSRYFSLFSENMTKRLYILLHKKKKAERLFRTVLLGFCVLLQTTVYILFDNILFLIQTNTGMRWDGSSEEYATANHAIVSDDGFTTENGGVGINGYAIFDGGMTLLATKSLPFSVTG